MTDSSENTRNYYRDQGATQERERIIKLLEDKAWEDEFGDYIIHEDKETLIALIKGEK